MALCHPQTQLHVINYISSLFFRGHIPQSVFFDLWKCVQSTDYIPRNLPDKNCFEDYAQSLGISPDTHIVAYDRLGPLSSYRTWWLFRVRPEFFYKLIYKPSYCNFPESRKKNSVLFYQLT